MKERQVSLPVRRCPPLLAAPSPPPRPHPPAQDRVIGKKVFQVRGLIPAGNYMQLPKKRNQTLGLTGRFVYILVGTASFKHTPAHTHRGGAMICTHLDPPPSDLHPLISTLSILLG